MFEPTEFIPDKPGYRTCGCCNESKPVSEYYRDGQNVDGSFRYRRDCKECYRKNRLLSRQAKRAPKPRRNKR